MNRRGVFLATALSFIWGGEFLFVALALRYAGTLEVTVTRCVLAAVVLVAFCLLRKAELPKSKAFYKHSFVLGLLAHAMPLLLLSFAQQSISSGQAGVLVGSVPLITLAMAALWLPSERINRARVAGLLIGFVGIVFVVAPWSTGIDADLLASLAGLGTAVGFAIGYVYNVRFLTGTDVPADVAMAVQASFACIWFVPALLLQGSYDVRWERDAIAIFSILGVVSTALGHIVFFSLLRVAGAVASTTVEYAMTVIAVVLGAIFLNEAASPTTLLGAALVITGIALVDRKRATSNAP